MILYDHLFVPTNGIRLHVVQAGPDDGLPVILLHGFPEFWYGWKKQLNALAAQGFRVWVPDQRGYNLSDKPRGIPAYNINRLVDDVVGLIDAMGEDQVYLAAHDWGAAVAWWLALKYPEHLIKLAILNVPHPAVFMNHVRGDLSQTLRSWYMFFFQIPGLPEWLLAQDNYAVAQQALASSALPGTFTPADLAYYREAWSQPGALTAMLNWYRAIIQDPPALPASVRVKVPTLMIWGAQDVALSVDMVQPSLDYCDAGRLVLFEDATHWVQHDKAAEVSQLLLEHFR